MGLSGGAANDAAFLAFSVLDQRLTFECRDAALSALVVADSPGLPVTTHGEGNGPALFYTVSGLGKSPSFQLSREGGPVLQGTGGAAFLSMLEQDLTVELQRRRPDLLFFHAACLHRQGRACLLVGDSGVGKSTTAWALLHHGFDYLSDELAPIDLPSLHVHPYPRALCLKKVPSGYPPPPGAVDLGATTHIPPPALPRAPVYEPKPLSAIFLLSRTHVSDVPDIHPLAPAEAAARLYVQALNLLAHGNRGLDAVMDVATRVPCFALTLAEPPASCALIEATLAA